MLLPCQERAVLLNQLVEVDLIRAHHLGIEKLGDDGEALFARHEQLTPALLMGDRSRVQIGDRPRPGAFIRQRDRQRHHRWLTGQLRHQKKRQHHDRHQRPDQKPRRGRQPFHLGDNVVDNPLQRLHASASMP